MHPIYPGITDLVDPIVAQHQARIRADAKATRHTGTGRLHLGAVLLMAVLAVLIVSATPVAAGRVRNYRTSSMPVPASMICPFFANLHSPGPTCNRVDLRAIDADDDGLSNGAELAVYGTDPHSDDTDGDHLTDFGEVYRFGTSPRQRDTDGDGLSDYDEVKYFGTNPLIQDSDGDGISDRLEFTADPPPPGIRYA